MTRQVLTSKGMLAIALVPVWLWAANVAGQAPRAASGARQREPSTAWTAPRTPWGDPDLQGFWTNTTTTPIERPDDLAGKAVLTDEELKKRDADVAARVSFDRPVGKGNPGTYNEFWMERGRLSDRTSLVIDPPDGKIPAFTPAGQKRATELAAARRAHPADSWEDRHAYERCITRGLPGAMMPGFYNHNYLILQTPTHVTILVEMIHDVRIIPIDGRPHLSDDVRQWLGDSRGHWEGNTLVVETTNFNDKVFETRTLGMALFGVGSNLRLIERFTRVDADTVDYQFTVDDPTVYTRPWTLATPMARIEGPIYEYACHEGNYSMVGILSGARAEEKAAEEAAAKK